MPFLSLSDLTGAEGTARGAGRGGEETVAMSAAAHNIQGTPDH